jgi:hypothetical protein
MRSATVAALFLATIMSGTARSTNVTYSRTERNKAILKATTIILETNDFVNPTGASIRFMLEAVTHPLHKDPAERFYFGEDEFTLTNDVKHTVTLYRLMIPDPKGRGRRLFLVEGLPGSVTGGASVRLVLPDTTKTQEDARLVVEGSNGNVIEVLELKRE